MRIIFFGADRWFSRPVLEALLAAGHNVPIVVTKGDDGNKFISSLVYKFGRQGKTRVIEGKTEEDISITKMVKMVKMAETAKPANHYNHSFISDAIVLASFGPPFLPAEVLKWPKYGCLNVHASLLPRWRGASPVFAALAAGDEETGVSIMKMTDEVDRGPVLEQRKIKIRTPRLQTIRQSDNQKGGSLKDTPLRILPNAVDTDTRETLTKRLGKLGGELIVETLKKLEKGQITETPQPQKSPTPYTRRLTKGAGRIDWSQSPVEIERFIRAAFPWPSAMSNAKFKMQNLKWQTIQNVKILKAHLEKLPQRDGYVPTGDGARNDLILVIDEVQLPGKNPVNWKQFLAGHRNAVLY